MNGFSLDENLLYRLRFTPSLPVQHARDIGESIKDSQLWHYAQTHNLVIITKDSDFSDRILMTEPPPRIIHLRFGNMRLNEFYEHLAKVWPRVETLIRMHKLVNVYREHLEASA